MNDMFVLYIFECKLFSVQITNDDICVLNFQICENYYYLYKWIGNANKLQSEERIKLCFFAWILAQIKKNYVFDVYWHKL